MNEETLFIEAVEIQNTAERVVYLDRACAGDAALRTRLERLLDEHDRAGSFLGHPAVVSGATGTFEPTPEAETTAHSQECAGAQIGPYKLLQQIGEGGMGTVFMAEQTEPVKRKVALKVIKPGMDSRQVIARFEAERQALAMMDHVNIARVFDGGTTENGRPYFVMELVHGVPITKYCDDNHLTPRQRLELFVPVCQAIQHAHQKGIIHRDIKPSNVMVTLYDGKPVPKVIDFGVAKATEQKLTERTLFTQYGTMVGTLEYMSPEQAEMSALGVDTRSDIYSLGVLLYELLTGSTPLTHKRMKEAAYGEILRMIKEEEPPKPSTRLSDSGEALASISAQRKTEPAKLSKLMRGELDWIVMKTLEKDRNRRYETANAFAADVQRYLADEPVLAFPPSAMYRFRKLARRNRRALATATVVGLALLLAVGSFGWMMRDRAARLAATEREVSLALEEAAKLQGEARWPEGLEAVKRAEGILAGGGSEELRGRVREMHKDLAMVLGLEEIRLGHSNLDHVRSDAAYTAAFREYGIDVASLNPEETAEYLHARTIRLELTVALDRWAAARRAARRSDEASWKSLLAVNRLADPDALRNQIRDIHLQGQSKALTREGLARIAAAAKISDLSVRTISLLAEGLDSAEAVHILRQAQQKYPDDYYINFQLAWALERLPRPQFDEALRFYTAAVALRPRNTPARLCLGNVLMAKGRMDEAIACYRTAIELDARFALAHGNLGAALAKKGQLEQAFACYRKALDLEPTGAQANNLAWRLATCPDPKFRDAKEAIALATKALQLAPETGNYWNTLGVAHYRASDWNAAIAALEKSIKLRQGGDSFDWFFLAMSRWQLGEKDEARKWYDRAVTWMDKNRPNDEELRRFREEAAKLLKLEDSSKPIPMSK